MQQTHTAIEFLTTLGTNSKSGAVFVCQIGVWFRCLGGRCAKVNFVLISGSATHRLTQRGAFRKVHLEKKTSASSETDSMTDAREKKPLARVIGEVVKALLQLYPPARPTTRSMHFSV